MKWISELVKQKTGYALYEKFNLMLRRKRLFFIYSYIKRVV